MLRRLFNPFCFSILILFACSALAEGVAPGRSDIELGKLKRTSQKNSGKDLFAAKSWGGGAVHRPVQKSVAVVAPPQNTEPVAPVVPPLPFAYMGKMLDEESGKLVLYLAKGDVSYSVSVGDLIDGTYRVAAVSDAELTLIYLPMNVKQTLNFGEGNS